MFVITTLPKKVVDIGLYGYLNLGQDKPALWCLQLSYAVMLCIIPPLLMWKYSVLKLLTLDSTL
jgi:hypothetical protein